MASLDYFARLLMIYGLGEVERERLSLLDMAFGLAIWELSL